LGGPGEQRRGDNVQRKKTGIQKEYARKEEYFDSK